MKTALEIANKVLSSERKVTPHPETMAHIARVGELMRGIVKELNLRAQEHDRSKTMHPEVDIYNEMIPLLNSVEFGTPEYKEAVKGLGPAWKHHKANNRHHPGYFENGIDDMNFVDLIEMLCDWKAASERGKGNKLEDSLPSSQKKYAIGEQLMSVIRNTLFYFEGGKKQW